jgi:hypothetical protein
LGRRQFQLALEGLEAAILDACVAETRWPARISAGINAGVDLAIANPAIIRTLTVDPLYDGDCKERYDRLVGRLAGFVRVKAPVGQRSPATSEAAVGGIVGLVGDHIRTGRLDRLEELRPELVLLTLLPYLGFEEAQRWANETARPD